MDKGYGRLALKGPKSGQKRLLIIYQWAVMRLVMIGYEPGYEPGYETGDETGDARVDRISY